MLTSEVVIQVIDDDVMEADEEFMLMISEITPDAMISDNSSSVNFKIIDDDGTLTLHTQIWNIKMATNIQAYCMYVHYDEAVGQVAKLHNTILVHLL